MVKKCITYLVAQSLIFSQLAYPVGVLTLPLGLFALPISGLTFSSSIYAQNQVSIQLPNSTETTHSKAIEPALGGSQFIQLPDLGDNSASNLSAFDEKKLGEKIIREIRKDAEYSNNWLIYDYLNQLGQSLVTSAREQKISGADAVGPFAPTFEFFAVKEKSINAFALPGGYIGIHTGLLTLAENESELASVLGHEIGHVTQKHIARGAGLGKDSSVLMLASILIAALAVKSNPNAAQGLAVGGQALAIQNQLSYSRDAEREADRIGFQILQAAGFNVSGMPNFFQKMQKATGISDSGVPAYIRTHPLTVERAADMQNRIRNQVDGRINSSLDFYLIQTLAKLEQQGGPTELVDTKQFFENQLTSKSLIRNMQGTYGLATIALNERKIELAEELLKKSQEMAYQIELNNPPFRKSNYIFDATHLQLSLLKAKPDQAIANAQILLKTYPHLRSIQVGYVESLFTLGKVKEAINWLVDQTKKDQSNAIWWNYLAKAYSQDKKSALYHAAIAEKYAVEGALPAAIQQLNIARNESENNFYQLSEFEARQKQFERLYREELIDNGKLERRPSQLKHSHGSEMF